ncbi:MAG TPA: ABC transporter substrate-binding protein [Qipengyuania sp.]|nr:ABC transporter substrate-binding protein [Qipengyuania sp.]
MRALAVPAFLLALALAACGQTNDSGVDVAVIGEPDEMFAAGNRLGPPAQLLRAATTQGLVRLDEAGQLVPGIAERWIVTADGQSYIFRIREIDLADGKRIDARAVQQALTRAIASLDGTTLGLDLAPVRDVRAMAGRVIEIRLESPMPGLLQLLAQPELGIAIGGTPSGPMAMTRTGPRTATLVALPPEARGLPAQPDWAENVQPIRLTTETAQAATQGFSDNRYALVLGGTLATLPLADVGALSRGTVRLDSALGLFGLDVLRAEGFLADAANREALALALDREALIRPFNLAGWTATTRVVAPDLPSDSDLVTERWSGVEFEERRAVAAARVARWKAANGGALVLSLTMPQGPGANTLFAGLAAQYAEIGIDLRRTTGRQRGDLALRDRVARYAGARWFLNQFHCGMSPAICSEDVDMLVAMSLAASDPAQRARYLADAETALAAYNAFIPIGAPIRWSQVRSGVAGFAENAWAIHPLFPLARAPM